MKKTDKPALTKMRQEFEAWIKEMGGIPASERGWAIETDFSILHFGSSYIDEITVGGPWIAACWEDILRAKTVLGASWSTTSRMNPHSGKWNWHAHEFVPLYGTKSLASRYGVSVEMKLVHVNRMIEMFKETIVGYGAAPRLPEWVAFDAGAIEFVIKEIEADDNLMLIARCGYNSPSNVKTALKRAVQDSIVGYFTEHENEPQAMEWFNNHCRHEISLVTYKVFQAFLKKHHVDPITSPIPDPLPAGLVTN